MDSAKDKRIITVRFSGSKMKARNEELAFLLELSNFLSGSLKLEDLLSGALDKVLEYLNMEAGRIYLKMGKGSYLHLAAAKGINAEGLEKVHVRSSFSGKAFQTKSFIAQHISQLEDKRRSKILMDRGFRYVVCVPLIQGNKAGGVMNLTTWKDPRLNQRKMDVLSAIGNQIAIASNNARLNRELTIKIKSLKEKNEMIKFFAYTVSHDLKSPAVSLHALARRLQEKYTDLLDEKGKTYCRQIMAVAEQMVTLVSGINDYISAKEAPSRFEPVDTKKLFSDMKEEFSQALVSRGIQWIAPEGLPVVIADKLALSRAFRNLADNALKYGGEALHKIEIQYHENDKHHIFSFSDDGVGIKPGKNGRLFQAFHRENSAKGVEGLGLGLAVVRETAQKHGGKAWAECNLKNGVSFHITLLKMLNGSEQALCG
jgi:K+-sensing histidine kinase KdpD